MNAASWQTFRLHLLVSIGVTIGIIIAMALRSAGPSSSPLVLPAATKSAHDVVREHTAWADSQGKIGLDGRVAELREFFAEARQHTRPFAEQVLSFDSKWKLVSQKVFGGDGHTQFVREQFDKHLFTNEALDAAVANAVDGYLRYLEDVDSQLLVRLQTDLADLPPGTAPQLTDREQLRAILADALSRALESVHAEFRGTVGCEVVGWFAGEVLWNAMTRLATSAGVLGTGAAASWATFGTSIIVSIIVDYVVAWVYDQVFDPAGELSRMLDGKLTELEENILSGDADHPGLVARLRDYAAHRAAARRQALDKAVSPSATQAAMVL